MSRLTVVYWRDIPAQVIAGHGRAAERSLLPERFQEAIDRAATRAGLTDSDAYMAEWRREPVEGEEGVSALSRRLVRDHPDEVLAALIHNHGRRAS